MSDEQEGVVEAPPLAMKADPWAVTQSRTFGASIDDEGFKVEVSITVTAVDLGPDVYEVSEHAQMTAARVAVLGRGTPGRPNRGPFRPAEPPF